MAQSGQPRWHGGPCVRGGGLEEVGATRLDHFIQPKHHWEKLFGGSSPTAGQLRKVIDEVWENGVDHGLSDIAGGGVQFHKSLTVNGHYVTLRGTMLNGPGSSTKLEISTGWVD